VAFEVHGAELIDRLVNEDLLHEERSIPELIVSGLQRLCMASIKPKYVAAFDQDKSILQRASGVGETPKSKAHRYDNRNGSHPAPAFQTGSCGESIGDSNQRVIVIFCCV
jgi:hypothetical protein